MSIQKTIRQVFFLLFTIFTLLVLISCQQSFTQEPINRKTPLFEFAGDYENRMRVQETARQLVANQEDISTDQVTILSTEKQSWTDNCLGLPNADEICSEGKIEGYMIVLNGNDHIYEVHSDTTATSTRLRSVFDTNLSPQEQTEELLAKQLNIATTEILVQSVEPVDWTNSCLDMETNTNCADVIIPGFRIILEAHGQLFEYHTDQVASVIYGGIKEEAIGSDQEPIALNNYLTISMQRTYFNSTMVEQLLVSSDMIMVVSNNEGFEKNGLSLTESEKEQLINWKNSFNDTNFTVRDEKGKWETTVHLYGIGQEDLPEFGQEVLLNFVLELYASQASPDTK